MKAAERLADGRTDGRTKGRWTVCAFESGTGTRTGGERTTKERAAAAAEGRLPAALPPFFPCSPRPNVVRTPPPPPPEQRKSDLHRARPRRR